MADKNIKEKIFKDKSNDYLMDKNVMYLSNVLEFKKTSDIENKDFYLLKITDVCYDEQAPKKEALENVLSSLKMEGINFIFLIVGRKEKVDFYYGISKDVSYNKAMDFAIKDIGDNILKPSIQGNFRGSKTFALNSDEREEILNTIREMSEVGVIEGVPGANKDDEKYQGIDRLINVMYGDTYCFMVVAKPLNNDALIQIQENLYKFYDENAPLAKLNIQSGIGTNIGTNESTSTGKSNTTGSSGSTTTSNGTSISDSHTEGKNKSHNESTSHGKSNGGSTSSTNESGSEGKTKGTSESDAHTTGTNNSTSETLGTSKSESTSNSNSSGTSAGKSESSNTSVEYINRKIQDFVKFMDDVVFPRLDYGKGKGTFLTSMCVFANELTSLQKIKNTVTALYSGETGNKVPLQAFNINDNAKKSFKSFQLPMGTYNKTDDKEYLTHYAMHHFVNEKGLSLLGNWITTNELGMIAGLPQKEVVGLSLNEEVEFGLNYSKPENDDNRIKLGCLIQNGNKLEHSPVYLDRADLDKHIFVAGVTGSGKTTTCQKILNSANMPFLVIEPAKTEYRVMIKNNPDMMIFTLGDNQTTPIKINPLMFYPKENITSRVDMICACIESAFDMEAAIPQIIEQAIYKTYEDKGWNVYTNKNKLYKNPFDGSCEAFPTISDVINKCEVVVNEQGFDDRLKNDYIGSIKARLLGLTSGGKGVLLDTQTSVDFMDLLNHKVVFELENIRSSAEKSLIMGFILINLSEAIREKYQIDGKFQHITLVEESHRLLSKTQAGDNPSKKQSVEMFSDMLAEIRKYGESLVIVDQIPNKLTPDVLKNTNTKIIHRIFASDDKEAVGNTVMLKDEQKDFLSNLPAGRAVYFTTGTEKAIQIQVDQSTDTSSVTPTNEEISSSATKYYIDNYKKGLYMGLELFNDKPTIEQFNCLKELNNGLVNTWNMEYSDSNKNLTEDTKKNIKQICDLIGTEILLSYINKYENVQLLYKYIQRHF